MPVNVGQVGRVRRNSGGHVLPNRHVREAMQFSEHLTPIQRNLGHPGHLGRPLSGEYEPYRQNLFITRIYAKTVDIADIADATLNSPHK